MAVQPDQDSASTPRCWCCGSERPEAELVRLGAHPEVGVCLDCAHWLRRRAIARHDERHRTPPAWLRARLQAVRDYVIGKGLHERGLLGSLLRRIDRHLP